VGDIIRISTTYPSSSSSSLSPTPIMVADIRHHHPSDSLGAVSLQNTASNTDIYRVYYLANTLTLHQEILQLSISFDHYRVMLVLFVCWPSTRWRHCRTPSKMENDVKLVVETEVCYCGRKRWPIKQKLITSTVTKYKFLRTGSDKCKCKHGLFFKKKRHIQYGNVEFKYI